MLKAGKRQITLAAAVIIISAIAGVTFARFKERVDTIALSMNTIDNYASIIAEQVNNGVLAIDLTLQEVVTNWVRRESTQAFAESVQDHAFRRHLEGDIVTLPIANFYAVVDESGRVIASAKALLPVGADIGQMAVFRSIRESDSTQLIVSRPDNEIVSGAWNVVFSRRLTTDAGAFLGAIILAVTPRMLLWTHNPLANTIGQSYGVFRSDGITLIRDLEGRDMTGEKIDGKSPWYGAVKAGGGRYRVEVSFEGGPRYVALRPLSQYPLVVTASASEEAVLSDWRRRTVLVYLLTLAYIAASMVGLMIIHDRYDALEASKAKTEQLSQQDSLTSLANRSHFLERLRDVLGESSAHGRQTALLLLDIDGFKDINDTYGHVAGDKVIQVIAERLTALCPDGLPARLGGDEFALIRQATSLDQLTSDVETIRTALSTPVSCDHNRIAVRLSVGVKVLVSTETNLERTLRRADLALYSAKKRGGDCHVVFEPSLEAAYLERATLASELRVALRNGQLAVHYQPIVRLSDGRTVAVEALARWPHPTRGFVGPNLFIPIAEDIGAIDQLGAFVLRQACEDLKKLPRGLRVCVNVSPLQLSQDGFIATLEAVLMESGVSPDALEIEVTETILLQNTSHNIKILDDVRRLGVHVALDDFGTGYSSLGYLRTYAFDTIKIDRTFVVDAHEGAASAKIIAATTMLAESLGLRTIAEGIETQEHLDAVRAAGVTCGQGYLLGRPAPIEEIRKTLGGSDAKASFAA